MCERWVNEGVWGGVAVVVGCGVKGGRCVAHAWLRAGLAGGRRERGGRGVIPTVGEAISTWRGARDGGHIAGVVVDQRADAETRA